jgi:hypothetical protein
VSIVNHWVTFLIFITDRPGQQPPPLPLDRWSLLAGERASRVPAARRPERERTDQDDGRAQSLAATRAGRRDPPIVNPTTGPTPQLTGCGANVSAQ